MSTLLKDIRPWSPRFGVVLATATGLWLWLGTPLVLATGVPHPFVKSFGLSATEPFPDPNGIAVDETTGDVYVADIGTKTVYKFDANGSPVEFSALKSNALTGGATPKGSFEFPAEARGTPAAIAVDNSADPSDPSRGDLYVMDAGHGVIDKFDAEGKYLSQIEGFTAFEPGKPFAHDNELLGLAVDANGTVRVDLSTLESDVAVDEFDDFSPQNRLVAAQKNVSGVNTHFSGVPKERQDAYGFAVGPTGDDYLLYGGSCSCTAKLGQQLAGLGELDKSEAGDVAVAADPATGHIYTDKQLSITEWDTGAMNGNNEGESAGTPVGPPIGPLSGSSSQGGIAIDGASGTIYVSNPALGNGAVYVFGSDSPAVTAGAATSVTEEAATLNGTVNPRGASIETCQFEYEVADEFGRVAGERYEHKIPCKPEPAEIGTGTSPVVISANIKDISPGLLYRFRLRAGNANGLSESAGLLATPGVGFGVKSFEVSFLNEEGTADTQAGSHPYEMVTNVAFNSHFQRGESNADSLYARQPDGTVKDLAVDLPPGLVGDPSATPKKCTLKQLGEYKKVAEAQPNTCPAESLLGHLQLEYSRHIYQGSYIFEEPVYNMVPPSGVALQLGVPYIIPDLFINNGVLAGGDYPVQATIVNAPASAPVLYSRLTILGVVGGEEEVWVLNLEGNSILVLVNTPRKAFLTLPTNCNESLRSSILIDSYQEPGHFVGREEVTRNSAGQPVSLTGCSQLQFPPTISAAPDTDDASTSSGLTVHVHVPQTAAFNPGGLAESSLRDTTVTLPEGVALNPAGANGLEACSANAGALPEGALGTHGDQIGFKGFETLNPEFESKVQTATFSPEVPNPLEPGLNFCPNGSKVATVKIKTPLLEHELEGAVYLAAQNANPFKSLIAMYIVAEDPASGSLIKLAGEVKLSDTGRIVTTFENTPDLPFEDLEIKFFGGERAPLTTPSRCDTYTTVAVFTPWDGNGPQTSTSSFNIEHGPHGGPCPGASLPFQPELAAGTTNNQAGGFSPFTMTMNREDGNQNLQSVSLKMPPGLSALLPGVELCPEPQADLGTCGPNSLIGETTVSVGVGNDPFTVKGGRVYLTGPYRGAPFGLSIVNPAKAGPYDVEKDLSKAPQYDPPCDCLVVRAKIEIDPLTTALTATSDNEGEYKIPPILDGVPLQIKHVNVTIDRPGFTINPTDCEPLEVAGELHSTEGATSTLQAPFQATNCARLAFKPSFKASTSAKTSRSLGASLHVALVYPKAPQGTQANIRSVKVSLPKQLPSRLTTLQKACPSRIFNSNPAACPAASRVGSAKAITPVLPVPLQGPAYFVSNGGAKFPELVMVLQGYNVTVDLHGETFINEHTNITSSTFRSIPDQPVTSFELTLPQGTNSALAANGNLCAPTKTVFVKKKVQVHSKGRTRTVTRRVRETVSTTLQMPTAFTAQNGAVIHQSTPIAVTGCGRSHAARHRKKK